MREILLKVDNDIVGKEMADMLMDTDISTYDMFEDLVTAYDNGNEDYRKGMNEALKILLWKDLPDIVEYMKEKAIKEAI